MRRMLNTEYRTQKTEHRIDIRPTKEEFYNADSKCRT